MAPANRKILKNDINVGRQALCPCGGALLQRYYLPSSSIRTMRAGSAKYLSSISRISIRGGRPRENLISRCGLGALDKYFPLAEEESPLSLLRPSLFSSRPSVRPCGIRNVDCLLPRMGYQMVMSGGTSEINIDINGARKREEGRSLPTTIYG